MPNEYDGVMIIGAGQQGLALGRELQQNGVAFVVLEKKSEAGAQWRKHYDSLELFTPRRYSSLPDFPMPGDPDGFPTKDEFARYLASYAKRFSLPVVFNAPVTALTKERGVFVAETPRGGFSAHTAVIAAGYQKPFIPPFAGKFSGFTLHSSDYKNPAQLPSGKVLVVGNGNSASQIAVELAKTHTVTAAVRTPLRTIRREFLGRNMYWWMEFFGLMEIPSDSFAGKLLARDKDYVIGQDLARSIERGEIERRPGVKDAKEHMIVFDDDTEETFDAVIWATGFRPDYSWIKIPAAFNQDGSLNQQRGISAVPGLYFAGLRNQLTNVSSNIYGAKKVSEFIAEAIEKTAKTK